jgi:hypothetical protein
MRYREIRMVEQENSRGEFRADINMDSFYRNMRLLQDTTDPENSPSDLEGIDAVVRLGYLGSVAPESILRNIGTSLPTQTGASGTYDSSTDRLELDWRMLFQPSRRLPGVSTAAHELRHRAFQIMSIDPRFQELLPEELTTGIWSDGWGRRIDWDKYTIRPQLEPFASDPGARSRGIVVVPEHAMIYAVQHRDIENHEKREWINNSVLGNRGAEYWRDLYRRVNAAVVGFFQQHFDGRALPAAYPSRGASSAPAAEPLLRLPAEIQRYYEAWQSLSNTARWDFDFASIYVDINSVRAEPWGRELARIWRSGHLGDLEEWAQRREAEVRASESGDSIFETVISTRPYWNLLDIRNYTPEQVQTIISVPTAPTPPTVPVEPVTPPENPQNPANPPLPTPKNRTDMSFRQFAQTAPYPGSPGRTIYGEIMGSPTLQILSLNINIGLAQAQLVGLRMAKDSQQYIDTLMAVFPGLWQENRAVVIDLYLSKIQLVE